MELLQNDNYHAVSAAKCLIRWSSAAIEDCSFVHGEFRDMKYAKFFFVVTSVASLSGCTADMVSSPNSGSASAPVNESSRPGLVKYLNDGAEYVRKERREDAYKKMHDACNGRYKIDAEGANAEGGSVIHSGPSSFWMQSNYWYIQFSCI